MPVSETKLLSRDEFREETFKRDGHRCVLCKEPAVDAHHIVDRGLWPDGGYYLANGASVCEDDHMRVERTDVSCEELRAKCGIRTVLLPPQFEPGEVIDKWGNPVLPNGQRLRGEVFFEPSVQAILAGHLHRFVDRVKYPRTYHLPWSPGRTSDDRVLPDLRGFQGREVVVTIKMDGENTTLARDYMHARSLTYSPHPSRNHVRALHGQIAHDIPEGMRVCGENLFAKHSIHYQHLPAHFLVFSVWSAKNVALSWDETCEWAELLGLATVPVLYRGKWDEEKIRALYEPMRGGDGCEGYVVRDAGEVPYAGFRTRVGKYVRASHVQTDEHWMGAAVVPNVVAPAPKEG